MAFDAFDAAGVTISFKATLDGSDLVPHKNIDLFCGKVVAFGSGATDVNTLRVHVSNASDIGGGTDLTAYVDGLEALITSSNTKLDTLHADVATTLAAYVDGLEGLVTSSNTKLDSLITAVATTLVGYVDGLETLIGSSNTKLDTLHTDVATTLAAFVDGLEGLITSSNTKLDTLHTDLATTLAGYVDGLETLITSSNTKLDSLHTDLGTTLAGYLDGVEAKLDTLARQPTSVKRLVSAAGTTNADFAKASAGTLYQVIGYNAAASVRYLKIFNKASAPTVGSDTPVLTIPLPPAAAFAIDIPPLAFATGIAFCLTTGVADADTGVLTAADVVGLNILYA